MSSKNIPKCNRCDAPIEAQAQYCHNCGAAVKRRSDTDPYLGITVAQNYVIESKIASGGMGVVYRARHTGLKQCVAVKFLHRRFADDKLVAARFHNEARAASRISHPNSVKIYDFGELPDGTLYIAMEHAPGVSLKRMLKERVQLPPGHVVEIMSQVADVLATAHEQEVIHRDVKPDNIMVQESASGRMLVKVLDFGIARILDEDGGGLTQTGMTFGTPEYMAPEQARGARVDARSDVYALGLVSYEMLAGAPPFRGKNKLALLQRQLKEAPLDLQEAAKQHVPVDLSRLIHNMLEKKASLRPQSMVEMLERLNTLPRYETSTSFEMNSAESASDEFDATPSQWSFEEEGTSRELTSMSLEASSAVSGASAEWSQVDFENNEGSGAFALGEGAGEFSLGGEDSFDDHHRPYGTAPGDVVGGRAIFAGASVLLLIVGVVLFMALRAERSNGGEGQGEGEMTIEGTEVADSEAVGSEATGSEVAGSEVAGSEVAGSEVAGSEVAGSEATGSEVAGSDTEDSAAGETGTAAAETSDRSTVSASRQDEARGEINAEVTAESERSTPPVQEADVASERVRGFREELASVESFFLAGNPNDGRSRWQSLGTDVPAEARAAYTSLGQKMDRFDRLSGEIRSLLQSDECVAANERVHQLQNELSEGLGRLYWGRLSDCVARTTNRPQPTSSGGGQRTLQRVEPTREL